MSSSFIQHAQPFTFANHSNVLFFQCKFTTANYDDRLYAHYNIAPIKNQSQHIVNKRKAEFLAGRYAAKALLTHYNLQHIQIDIGENRSPNWPQGIIGSISHNKSTAICAMTQSNMMTGLGIDVEAILDTEKANRVKESIIDKTEEELLNTHAAHLPFNVAFTLIFSAKESIFKALYPQVKRYFGFSAVSITAISLSDNTLTFRLNESLTPQLNTGLMLTCDFILKDHEVITFLALD